MSTFPSDRLGEARPRLTGEYDALADLFLGHDAPPANSSPLRLVQPDTPAAAPVIAEAPAPTRRAAHVEAMLLGSLPVYASAWVTQFVRVESQRLARPVVLVRTLAGEGSVDVLGGAGSEAMNRADTLDAAISAARASCDHFLLRTGETGEADLATHEGVDSVVVLTGVDEPALIAAYRTLKMLAPRWATRSRPPAVRIAAMGANEEQGRRAFEKIERAARVFLETPLAYAGHVERIEPAPTACLFRGPMHTDSAAIIETIRADRKADSPTAVEAPAPEPIVEPKPAQPTATAPVAPPSAPVEASNNDDDDSPLSARVPGLAPAPFRIPRCEGVELAADASGGLHLLARDDDSANPTAALLAAQAWVGVNRQVLALACATALGAGVDADRPATLHLFTADPRRVRPLLDADIRVHFLGSVEINGKRAWCVAELN